MTQGQLFTSDFVASVIIFLTVMNVGFFAIQQSVNSQSQFNEQKQMSQQAYQTGDLLVRTPGYPPGWNRSTVRVVGLASQGQVLNNTKLSEFRLVESYTEQRKQLGVLPNEVLINVTHNGSTVDVRGENGAGGLGNQPVAVVVENESADIQDHEFINALNTSKVVWDLYWPSTNDQESLPSLTARTIFNHTTDAAAMMDDVAANLSDMSYQIVLLEDVGVVTDQIPNSDEFARFVGEGGTLVHAGNDPEFIHEIFDLGSTSDGDESGFVKQTSSLLNQDFVGGDTVTFDTVSLAFEEPDTVYVNGTNDPNCLVCRWNRGAGEVFYVADTHTNSGGSVFENGSTAMTGRMPLRFGRPVADTATTVAVSRRSVIVNSVDGFRQARMKVILWR